MNSQAVARKALLVALLSLSACVAKQTAPLAPTGGGGSGYDGPAPAAAEYAAPEARPSGRSKKSGARHGGGAPSASVYDGGDAYRASPPEKERPGLGTSFGESRYSPAREQPF